MAKGEMDGRVVQSFYEGLASGGWGYIEEGLAGAVCDEGRVLEEVAKDSGGQWVCWAWVMDGNK